MFVPHNRNYVVEVSEFVYYILKPQKAYLFFLQNFKAIGYSEDFIPTCARAKFARVLTLCELCVKIRMVFYKISTQFRLCCIVGGHLMPFTSTRITNAKNKFISNIGNDRFKSWEICHNEFYNASVTGKYDSTLLSLHLTSFLASWGMYRGSSFLLRFDYKIHEPVVEWLLSKPFTELFDGMLYQTDEQKYMKLLFGEKGIIAKLNEYYKNARKVVKSGEIDEVSATLITKILMGVYGCIPAYDRYFVDGLGKFSIQKKFSERGVGRLLKYIKPYQEAINNAAATLNEKFNPVYTPMKVVDMYFWEKGQ